MNYAGHVEYSGSPVAVTHNLETYPSFWGLWVTASPAPDTFPILLTLATSTRRFVSKVGRIPKLL